VQKKRLALKISYVVKIPTIHMLLLRSLYFKLAKLAIKKNLRNLPPYYASKILEKYMRILNFILALKDFIRVYFLLDGNFWYN
jgi:hypothetical protein